MERLEVYIRTPKRLAPTYLLPLAGRVTATKMMETVATIASIAALAVSAVAAVGVAWRTTHQTKDGNASITSIITKVVERKSTF